MELSRLVARPLFRLLLMEARKNATFWRSIASYVWQKLIVMSHRETHDPKTDKERKAAERQRYKDAGLVRLELWVHPRDADEVKRVAWLMGQKRLGDNTTAEQPARAKEQR
jgi:hypothetical protein